MCVRDRRGTSLGGESFCISLAVNIPVHDAAAVAKLKRPHHLEEVGLPTRELHEREKDREKQTEGCI